MGLLRTWALSFQAENTLWVDARYPMARCLEAGSVEFVQFKLCGFDCR